MNNDLISRSALLAWGGARTIREAVGNWGELDNKAKAAVLRYAQRLKRTILDTPAVDAVEVVRCRDCIHNVANLVRDPLDTTDYSDKDIVCAFWLSDGLEPDDYCSRGKMKGGSL